MYHLVIPLQASTAKMGLPDVKMRAKWLQWCKTIKHSLLLKAKKLPTTYKKIEAHYDIRQVIHQEASAQSHLSPAPGTSRSVKPLSHTGIPRTKS